MSYSRLILKDCADIVWPFDDLTESASISRSINFLNDNIDSFSASINPGNTNVIFTPIVFGGGYSLSLTSSAIGFSIPAINRFSELYNGRDSVISFWFQSNKLFTQEYPIFKKRGSQNIGLFIKDNYLIFRYGNSASYTQVAGDIVDIDEPNHVVMTKNSTGITLMINGISYISNESINLNLDKDINHSNNNYLDFYGPPSGNWVVDCVAMYPNSLLPNDAKRHYVYGLGKNINDDIFYSRGGVIYNFSTISTDRLVDIDWRYPYEWKLSTISDLLHETDGLKPLKYKNPTLFSYDNNIQTASNSIKFSSASVTQASYIEIDAIEDKIDGGRYPFFVKVTLNGELPDPYEHQRIISYGIFPQYEILKFDLYNNSSSYQLKVSSTQTTASLAFNIVGAESSPSFYVGMDFSENSEFYFCQSGSSIQSASFSYYTASGNGLDPMIPFFPPPYNSIIRIGGSLNYDKNSYSNDVYGVDQFYGSFNKFMILQPDFTSSANYDYLEQYRKTRYGFYYDSSLNRFKIQSYGYADFNLHSIQFAQEINDTNRTIGGNIVRFGYPDIESASQVFLYATLLNYSGSVVHPKTLLGKNNYLQFINNTNLDKEYIKFEFEIYSEDLNYYPPKIKYFNMETYKNNNGRVVLKDQAGPPYTIYPTASVIYLPETRYTPSIFMTETSGLKINNSKIEFFDNIAPHPLNPLTLVGLKLWLDARFINGLNKQNPIDDSRVLTWKDLSINNNNAIQQISASAPVFRVQSQNIFKVNQLNGSENDNLTDILTNNCSIESSSDGAVNGSRGIKVIPDESSLDSYIKFQNTASISVYANQTYSVFGSIKLTKRQSASAFHDYSRRIMIYTNDGVSNILTASTVAAPNSVGTYHLSASFTTSSATKSAEIRFYNGSFKQSDFIYWDNLGLYPTTGSVLTASWSIPLTTISDTPVLKFNGNEEISVSSSFSPPMTLYIVGRIFDDGSLIGYSSSGVSIYSLSNSIYLDSASQINISNYNNIMNVYTMSIGENYSKLYINNIVVDNDYPAVDKISNIILGNGQFGNLKGDIAAVLLFSQQHNNETVALVNEWLDESFNLPATINFEYSPDSIYQNTYSNEY